MARTITKAEQEAFEKVAIKFNLTGKWVDDGKREGKEERSFEIARDMLIEGCDVDLLLKLLI